MRYQRRRAIGSSLKLASLQLKSQTPNNHSTSIAQRPDYRTKSIEQPTSGSRVCELSNIFLTLCAPNLYILRPYQRPSLCKQPTDVTGRCSALPARFQVASLYQKDSDLSTFATAVPPCVIPAPLSAHVRHQNGFSCTSLSP